MELLEHGAIALLDALGMKGIWRREDGACDTSALNTLKTVIATVEGMIKYCRNALVPKILQSGFWEYNGIPNIEYLAFSDTVAVTATLPVDAVPAEQQDLHDSFLIDIVSQCAAYILRKAPQATPSLVYRGVVTCGELLVNPPFLLGPAIDEAAGLYEQAEGAFVWLSPSAEVKMHAPPDYSPHVWKTMAVRYNVPLKNDRTVTTIALSPYVDNREQAERRKIRDGMMQPR